MSTILQEGKAILRERARQVPLEEIGTDTMQAVLAKMQEALAGEEDGVAIAAPQIGEPRRIFIVSGRVFVPQQDSTKDTATPSENASPPDKIFINPELVGLSKEKQWLDEGCLSVRFKYGEVERATKATVRALDAQGNQFELGSSGLLAQIFQHEIDHLNGILFTDKARNVHDQPPKHTTGSE